MISKKFFKEIFCKIMLSIFILIKMVLTSNLVFSNKKYKYLFVLLLSYSFKNKITIKKHTCFYYDKTG